MSSFILRKIDPDFWAQVQSKAKTEGIPIKALILKLLAQWLAVPVFVFALSSVIGCGSSSSPTAPSPPPVPPVPPAPTTVTLTGRLTAVNGGQPLGGVSTTLTGQTAVTDGGGNFRYTLTPGTTNARLDLTGSGIVPRSLLVAIGSTRDVNVNAIGTAGFDLNFYRQFIRNAVDAPSQLDVLRRWTRTPMIYLKTVDEAGTEIDPTTLTTVETTIIDAVPRWTSGRLGTPVVERGTGSREGQAGWITIKFPPPNTEEGHCGRAQVGQEGGWVELYYTRVSSAATRCRLGRDVVSRVIIRHEIGHALGFRHTDNPGDVMYGVSWTNADLLMSARELAAAAIAYQRPVGNLDPDADPIGTVTLQPLTAR